MGNILKKNNYFWGQLLLLIGLQLFAGSALAGAFLRKPILCADTLRQFSIFRDNLHALNYFGEIQWWNPNVQGGFPMYYPSILLLSYTTPLFAVVAAASWILGLLHIHLPMYQPVYVIYFGFLIPFMVSLGLLLLARQIFADYRVIFFILVLSSFGPATVCVLTNFNVLEHTAYGFYFTAALLQFLRKPGTSSFWAFSLAALILVTCFGYLSLMWNVIFIPSFLLSLVLFPNIAGRDQIRQAARAVPRRYWGILLLLILFCSLLQWNAASQGTDVIRASIGSRKHSFYMLNVGSSLEFLTSGTPGIGFMWTPSAGCLRFGPQACGQTPLEYTYLGMLILALSVLGLIVGRYIWRMRLLLMLTIASVIVPLVTFSPIFASLLFWLSPLCANSHYSDTFFRIGTSFLLILSAGLGLQVILRSNNTWRWLFVFFFVVASVWSTFLFLVLNRGASLSNPIFGFALAMLFLYLTVVTGLALAKRQKTKNRLFLFLLFFTLVDTSTVAFWHVRNVILPNMKGKVQEPTGDSIGLGNVLGSDIANKLLELRQIRELKDTGIDVSALPVIALFDGAKTGVPSELRKLQSEHQRLSAVFLPEDSQMVDEFKDFFKKSELTDGVEGKIMIREQTYNTLRLVVVAPRRSLLFWRDAFFPYWKATVDGKGTQIAKAFWAFKAIAVPSGKSIVEFRFRPAVIPYTLLLSYAIIIAVLILWLNSLRHGYVPHKKSS